jgi:Do/DeqQ family serine protease
MNKNLIILSGLCLVIIGCKCQDSKFNSSKKPNQISLFEEKQRRDIARNNIKLESKSSSSIFNFREAAKKVTLGVVYIRATFNHDNNQFFGPINDDFWRRFFSDVLDSKFKVEASGVIVSSDGYIVTNDHVIENADDIEVLLHDKRVYKAKVVGIDPETDLALLKIQETNMNFIEFGNSDDVEVGDWVLAVGNPFNLTSTVTSGIVSAKARNINILKRKDAVESYIQTDAVMNIGNSGGALVDYQGKLIGINAAITTPTGAFAGYSFAIPVNIVKKIIDDLLINGKVKRGYLGMVLKNISDSESRLLNTKITNGVYVDSLITGGAAIEAELKTNDIITAIGNRKIETLAQLQEIIAQHRPGEKIIITVIRKGKEKKTLLTLKEYEGTETDTLVAMAEMLINLGIRLVELSEKEKKQLKLSNGLKITEIKNGKIDTYTSIKPGFIIIKVNGKAITTREEFIKEYLNTKDVFTLEGVYPSSSIIYFYSFDIG